MPSVSDLSQMYQTCVVGSQILQNRLRRSVFSSPALVDHVIHQERIFLEELVGCKFPPNLLLMMERIHIRKGFVALQDVVKSRTKSEDVVLAVAVVGIGSRLERLDVLLGKAVLLDAPVRPEKTSLEVTQFDRQIFIREKIVDVDIAVKTPALCVTATASAA